MARLKFIVYTVPYGTMALVRPKHGLTGVSFNLMTECFPGYRDYSLFSKMVHLYTCY